jgi:hypothetical protein
MNRYPIGARLPSPFILIEVLIARTPFEQYSGWGIWLIANVAI